MSKQVPNVKFVIRPEKEFITITSDDIFKDKTIVLFALPGAFTPTCNDYHLPGYELNQVYLMLMMIIILINIF